MSLGLYIHVPFCSAICNYCTFNRGLFDHALKTEYVSAAVKEIQRASEARETEGAAADTIFFGGGTPSLLEPDEIGAMVDACRRGFASGLTSRTTRSFRWKRIPRTLRPTRSRRGAASG